MTNKEGELFDAHNISKENTMTVADRIYSQIDSLRHEAYKRGLYRRPITQNKKSQLLELNMKVEALRLKFIEAIRAEYP